MEEVILPLFQETNNSGWNETEFDIDAYLEGYLGPKSLPLENLIPYTLIYILLLCCGVFGNVMTIYVILTNQYMHTATNYYLLNLSISDLSILLIGK